MRKTDNQLRRAVEWRIGRKLRDAIWRDLGELRGEYLEGKLEGDDKKALEVIAEAAQRRVDLVDDVLREEVTGASGTHVSAPSIERDSVQKDGPSEWADRAVELFNGTHFIGAEGMSMLHATSTYLEWRANQHPEVVRFRKEVLGGNLLNREQAAELLISYAARFLSAQDLSRLGVPLTKHTSEIIEGYEEIESGSEIDHRVTIKVEPPGLTLRLRYADPNIVPDDGELVRGEFRGDTMLAPYNLSLPGIVVGASDAAKPKSKMGPFLLQNVSMSRRPSEVWPGSLVDRIFSLSEYLAHMFRWPSRTTPKALSFGRWWSEDAAAEFVLTGIAPLTRPIEVRVASDRASSFGMRRVELDLSPWIHDDDVLRAYRRARREAINKQNQWPSPKTREVVRFVLRRRRASGYEKPSWRVLRDEWNRIHPDDRIEDHRHLNSAFKRGCSWIEGANFPGSD